MLTSATHSNLNADMWISQPGASTQITFKFDDSYAVNTLRVWNYNQVGYTTRGIRHATVEYSKNGIFWNTLYADYEIAKASGSNGVAYTQAIDCKGVTARYIRLTPHALTGDSQSGNWGYTAQNQVGLSEVEFEVSEPNYLVWNPATMTVTADSQVDADHRPELCVNGAGLDASGLLHNSNPFQTTWLSSGNGQSNSHPGTKQGKAWVSFAFDKTYKLNSLRIWNYGDAGNTNRGLQNVTIEYSTDNKSWITLMPDNGSPYFTFNQSSGTNNFAHETVVNFLGREAKYVVITANLQAGNWGGDSYGIAEARFQVSDAGSGLSAFCGVGDHLWVTTKEPVDSPATINAMFEWMSDTYGIDRMYWRDTSIWDDNFTIGEQTQSECDLWKWVHRLLHDVPGYASAATDAAHEHGMEMWLYAGLFEAGVQPDVGTVGSSTYMFEDNIRVLNPGKAPLNRWGDRQQPGMLAFCYPEVRTELVNRYLAKMNSRGYDGINFYTYVENRGIRYENEFGFDQPVVDKFHATYSGVDLRTANSNTLSADQLKYWYKCQGEFVTTFLTELKAALKVQNKRLSVILDPNDPDYPQPSWGETLRGTGKIEMDWKKWIDDGIVDEIWVQLADVAKQKALLDQLLAYSTNKPIKLSVRTTDPLGAVWDPYIAQGVKTIAVITWENNNGIEKYSPASTSAATLGSSDWKVRLQTLSDIAQGSLSVAPNLVSALASDPNVLVRRMTVNALAKLGDPSSVSVIEGALQDPESSVRIAAVSALASPLHGTRSVAAIYDALGKGEYFQFKERCVNALSHIASLTEVTDQVTSPSQAVREVSVRVLSNFGHSAGNTNLAFTTLRNSGTSVTEAPEVRYWAIAGQIGLRDLVDSTSRDSMVADFRNIIGDDTQAPLVQLQAAFGLENLASSMSSPQKIGAAADLVALFKKYKYNSTREDADYGWRMVGNALLQLGTYGTEPLRAIMDPQISSVTGTASGSYDISHTPSRTVDGSGLSYSTHDSIHTNMWLSKLNVDPWIIYQFDKVYKLKKMQFWNYNQAGYSGRGIRHAKIEYSIDGATWQVLSLNYEFAQAPGLSGYIHTDDVWFNGVAAQYVKITPLPIVANSTASGNWGDSGNQVGISEVIFNIDHNDPSYPDYRLSWLAYQVLYEKQQAKTADADGFNLVTEDEDMQNHKRYAPDVSFFAP